MQVAALEGGLKSLKVETHVIPRMAIITSYSFTGFIVLRCCLSKLWKLSDVVPLIPVEMLCNHPTSTLVEAHRRLKSA